MAGWVQSTPVSIEATTIPSPRTPLIVQTSSALTIATPYSIVSTDPGESAAWAVRPVPPNVPR